MEVTCEDEQGADREDGGVSGGVQATGPLLTVRFAQGEPREALFHVLVGCWESDHDEALDLNFDADLQRRMTRIVELGIEPGKAGAGEVILCTAGPTPGVVLIGLGRHDELDEETCARAVDAGIVRLALATAQLGHLNGVSALLIGSSPDRGLTAGAAAGAIVEGVMAALLRLGAARGAGLAPCAPSFQLQLIDVWEHRLLEAQRAVEALVGAWDEPVARRVQIVRPFCSLSGRRSTLLPSPAARPRRQLRVTSDGLGALRYELVTERARAERVAAPVPATLYAEGLRALNVQLHRQDSSLDDGQLASLWRRIVPAELRPSLARGGDLEILVDGQTAAIPWELLWPAAAAWAPGAFRGGVVRRYLVSGDAPRPLAQGWDALVIGDPRSSRASEVPEAARSAEEVARLLGHHGFKVELLVNAPDEPLYGDRVIEALHRRPWRVIYIIGHGAEVFERGRAGGRKRSRAGLSLARRVPGTTELQPVWVFGEHITPLDVAPELVALISCRGGALPAGGADPDHAPDLAEELLRLGVQMVVAAGWGVEARPAAVFGEDLIRELMRGRTFGEATLAARSACHAVAAGGRRTWAAWQCYGPAEHRLVVSAPRSRPPIRLDPRSPAPSEVLAWLEASARPLATLALERGCAVALQELKGQLGASDGSQTGALADARVQELLGLLHLALGDWRGAISRLEGAVASDEGRLHALKLLADAALEGASTLVGRDPAARALLARSRRIAEGLLALGESPQRQGLLAAILRREAWLFADEPTRRDLLVRSRALVHKAWIDSGDPYHGWHATADGLLLGLAVEPGALDALEAAVEERRLSRPHFWTRTVLARLELLRLIQGQRSLDQVVAAHHRVAADVSTPRDAWQVACYLDYLGQMLSASGHGAAPSVAEARAAFWAQVVERCPGLVDQELGWDRGRSPAK